MYCTRTRLLYPLKSQQGIHVCREKTRFGVVVGNEIRKRGNIKTSARGWVYVLQILLVECKN